jgi:hypothetical protein
METKTDVLIQEVRLMQAIFMAYANSVLTEEQKTKFIEMVKASGIKVNDSASENS